MEIIVKPILSEKMTEMNEKLNKVAFVVVEGANKITVKQAVEAMYNVKVTDVNIIRYQGKAKSRYTKAGMISGRTASYKKAIVTLAQGDSIDFYSNI